MNSEPSEISVHLDFWGTSVKVRCDPSDAPEIGFFYGAFMANLVPEPDVTVWLRCASWSTRGFFKSLLANDGLEKYLEIRDNRDSRFSVSRVFHDWSGVPSPLPPFATSTMRSRVAVYPGAVVRLADGRLMALIGENYVGKTSTAIALCRVGLAELVSDSLIVLDLDERVCLTYETPLGFRREGLRTITNILDQTEHRLTVSPDTGLVALVQPAAVLGRPNAPGGRVDHLVRLSVGAGPKAETFGRPDLRWFTAASPGRVRACLPERAVRVQVLEESPPEARAAAIVDSLAELGAVP